MCNLVNIPNISTTPPSVYTPHTPLPPPEHRPNLSCVLNIKFTKNDSSASVFMHFARAIYLPSFSTSGNTLPKLIPAGTRCQNNKEQPLSAIN